MKPYELITIDGNEYRIYPNEYLLKNKFTRDEVDDFICDDQASHDLYNSFTVNAWQWAGRKETPEEVLRIMLTDRDWYKKKEYTWSKEKKIAYERIVHDILMNCLEMDSEEAWHETEIWGGFGGGMNLDDMSRKNFDAYLEERQAMIDEYEKSHVGEEKKSPDETPE